MYISEGFREEYLVKRRRKKIKHTDIASHIGCSQSLISHFELGTSGMSEDKIIKYINYIDNKKMN